MAELSFPPLVLASSSSSIITTAGATIISYNPQTQKTITSPLVDNRSHQNGFIRHIAVSQDEKIIVSIGHDKSLKVWDVTKDELNLRSTRGLIKKASHVVFSPDGAIIISDKVGDVYSYPLDPIPSDPSTSRPPMYSMVSDPTKNPDCTYLLGHVSVCTSHLITPDSKYIITADRDEHIRISRYPKAYVIENQLFGHDGFVSSIHIPSSQPSTLISGGGDSSLRIWDWTTGKLLSKVDVYSSILPHRKVRSYLRKRIQKGKSRKVEETPSTENEAKEGEGQGEGEGEKEEEEETFYSAPEGYMLPSGQGVCIKKIDSVKVGDKTIVLFFSEGASAIHSFILPSDSSASPPTVQTLPLPYPMLDFTFLPNEDGKVLLSLDTAWGVLKKNPGPGTESRQDVIVKDELSEAEKAGLNGLFRVIEIGENAELTESSSPSFSTFLSSLPKGDIKTISNLNLYPLINILPRWPGLEEQEESSDSLTKEDMALVENDGISLAPTSMTARTFGGTLKTFTKEELSTMNSKVLGRLKSQGVDIGTLLLDRQKKAKEERRRKLAEINARDKALDEKNKQGKGSGGNGKGGQGGQGEPEKKKKKVQISEEDLANS